VKEKPDEGVLRTIARIPDGDIAALLFAWWSSGAPWIHVGEWQIWSSTSGAALASALRQGKWPLPFGVGPYDDPIYLRRRGGEVEIHVASNPDDTAPRSFRRLGDFVDAMIADRLDSLRSGDGWPLPNEVGAYFDSGAMGPVALGALERHVRFVAFGKGEAKSEAEAWLETHTRKPFDPAGLPMSFVECDDIPEMHPPAEVDALLKAGGHVRYEKHGDRWLAVTKKGIRFLRKGKRRTASTSSSLRLGAGLAVSGDVAMLGSNNEVVRVDLESGKKERVLSRPFGEVAGVASTPDTKALVLVPRTEDYTCETLEVLDLQGEVLGSIALPPEQRFLRGLVPLVGSLVAVAARDVTIVDVEKREVVGFHPREASELRV